MVENIYSMLMVIKMNKLNEDKEFSLFIMEDVFDLFSGALVPNDELKEGNIPRVTATASQNGIAIFTNDIEHKNFRVFENFISISFLGDVFYHKTKTSLDMKIHGVKPKKMKLNMYIAQYLIPLLRNFSSKFSYGNQLSMRLLKRQRIMLPVNNKNQVDWEFMEEQGKALYDRKHNDILKYLRKKQIALKTQLSTTNEHILEEKSWAEFVIEDIVDIKSGVRLTKDDQKEGSTPFIGATEYNNGVTAYVSNINNSLDSNVIGVNYNGAVVESFYHPYKALFSDDVKRIELKNTSYQNKYVYLFLITMIEMQKKKYMYSYKFNAKRMSKQKILLPINSIGNPDWNFMENYMKQIEYENLTKIINYLS